MVFLLGKKGYELPARRVRKDFLHFRGMATSERSPDVNEGHLRFIEFQRCLFFGEVQAHAQDKLQPRDGWDIELLY